MSFFDSARTKPASRKFLPKHFVRLLLLCNFIAFWSSAESLASRRVAIFGPADTVAVLEAELSSKDSLEVVARDELVLLLGERVLGSLADQPPSLGRLLAVDVFLMVEDGPHKILKLVDAATGEEMARRLAIEDNLAGEAMHLLSEVQTSTQRSRAPVAISDAEDARGRAAAMALSEWLAVAGNPILNRRITWPILEERARQSDGFVDNSKILPAFPAASRLVQILSGPKGVTLTILSSDGAQRGQFVWKSAPVPNDQLKDFLDEHLGNIEAEIPAEFRQRVNIEALLPFYEGISLFESGDFFEAILKFQQAYEMNHLFLAAYEWEMRCYEAIGLPEFALAMERWMDTGFSGRGVAAGGDVGTRDVVLFAGVSGESGEASAKATSLAFDAMDVLAGPELLLPSALATIREEYDKLTAASPRTGTQWTTSPGFVSARTLRGRIVGENCEWTLTDDLGARVLARAHQSLKGSPEDWEMGLQVILPRLLADAHQPEPVLPKAELHLPCREEAERNFKKAGTYPKRYKALLQLLLLDPGNPLVTHASLRKREEERNYLDSYLHFAKQATLLESLPADHPMRPWIELEQIQLFLPSVASGPHLSGENRDALAGLKRFSEALPNHPARVLARFLWLTDTQATMRPEQLATEARSLTPRMRSATEVPQNERLAKMCEALEWLGRAAAGEPVTLDPSQVTPRAYRMEIDEKRGIQLDANDDWRVEAFRILPLTREEIVIEAQAAIAIGGRVARRKTIDPAWMEKFSGSFSMASFVGWMGIYQFGHPDGRPHPFPGDYEKLRSHWQEMISYAATNLHKWLERVETKAQFVVIDAPLQWFFPAIAGASSFEVTSEEYDKIHRHMMTASAAAAARLGIPNVAPQNHERYRIDWRKLTWEEARKQGQDSLTGTARLIRDIPEFGTDLHAAARRAFVDEFPAFGDWWRLSSWGLDEAISNRDFATNYIVPYIPDIFRTYGTGPLSDDERAMLLDLGVLLMWGWRYAEAESIYRLVMDSPPATGSDPELVRALGALALLNQARLDVQSQNKPAAIQALQRCLDVSEGLEIRNLWRIKSNYRGRIFTVRGQRNNLRSLAGRMLEELRFDPTSASFAERVDTVRIPTRQLENSEVTIFYRLPPPAAEPPRVLVLVPAFNEGAAALCGPESPWSRFADTHNLALIVPQFFQVHTIWKVDHPCAPYHFPQLWAGQVVLDAIDQISQKHPLQAVQLFLHGQGAGAQFAARFARWKPDRVAALSLHSGAGDYPWKEREQGLHPLSAFQNLPVLLTTGAKDDEGVNFTSRRAASDNFWTTLKGHGAKVNYQIIDTTFHKETPRLRELAENFLATQIQTTHP